MADVEVYSWWFVNKKWTELRRMPTLDKGFEESFREYLYRKINFDVISDIRDTGFGLSYSTLSTVPHELDVICVKDRDLFVFELKHYEVSDITKELVFTFIGKVVDFYFKNAEVLSNYKITMLFVTINKDIDDSIRNLCIAYGVKLIEPSIMTLGTLDYFSRDLQGMAHVLYMESFIQNKLWMKITAYLNFVLASIFYFISIGEIIIRSSSILSIFPEIFLWIGSLFGSWMFIMTIYIKFIKKYNLKEEDIRFLFYSVLYG